MMGVRSFHFRGNRIAQQVRDETMSFELLEATSDAPALQLKVEETTKLYPLKVGVPIQCNRGLAKIGVVSRQQ